MKILHNKWIGLIGGVLLCVGLALVIAACEDNDSNTTYEYACANGMAVAEKTDKSGVTNCMSCNNFFKLNTSTMSCEATSYTCSNGTAADGKPNETADGGVADKNVDIEKCKECDFGHALANGVCTLSTVGQWRFDVDATCTATAACVVTMVSDGSLVWQNDCAPHAPLNTYTNYEIDDTSIIFKGGGSQHDFTIDAGDANVTLNPQSTTLSGNRYLCPFMGASVTQPTVDGNIVPSGTTFTTIVSHDGTLYWAVYADDAVVADGAALIAGVKDSTAGVARGDAAGMAVTAGSVMFSVSGLAAYTNYDLYVALETTVDGFSQQVLSDKYDITTVGFAYVCEQGTPAMGDTANPDTTKCTECTTAGYTLINEECVVGFAYICANGTADKSVASPTDGVNRCTECDPGFTLGSYSNSCARPFALDSHNDAPSDMWSNGTTLWVLDSTDHKVYAYALADGTRDPAKEFDLDSSHPNPSGMWSDGTTVWIASDNNNNHTLYAYTLSGGVRNTDKDIALMTDGALFSISDFWSDGSTVWVPSNSFVKVLAFSLTDGSKDTSQDIPLANANTVIRGTWSDGTTLWVADRAENKVFAYTLDGGARDSDEEFNLDSDNIDPSGIWGNDSTLWVVDSGDDKVYAYSLDGGARDSAKEFDMDSDNGNSAGAWSNGTTLWVVDGTDDKVIAYSLATGTRDSVKDFALHTSNQHPTGIWSNGTTVWIADTVEEKLFAYTLADGTRDESKEFDLFDDDDDASNTDNFRAVAVWSNGTTIWVTNEFPYKVFAYALNGGTREASKEFDLHTDNRLPRGAWGDGTTLWVADISDNKVYAYTLLDRARDESKEFDLDDENGNSVPSGIWSNGSTIWVTDLKSDSVFVY